MTKHYFDINIILLHIVLNKCFRCSVNNIPTISVVQMNGKWITADNRRLWVFRQLERLGKCDKVFVQKARYIPESKLTSENGGLTVHVRGSPGGYWHRKASATKQRTNTSISSSHNIYGLNSPVNSTHNVVTNTYQISGYGINVRPVSDSRNNEFNVQKQSGDQRGLNNYGSRVTGSQSTYQNEYSPNTIKYGNDRNSYTTTGRQEESSPKLITNQSNHGRINSYGTTVGRRNESVPFLTTKQSGHGTLNSYGVTTTSQNLPDKGGLKSHETSNGRKYNKQNGTTSKSTNEQRMYRETYNRSNNPNVKGILKNNASSDIVIKGKDTGCCVIL